MRSLADAATLGEFVRNLREGVYITNANGEILDANPAFLQMFGVAALAELRNRTASDLMVDPARRAEEVRILERDGAVREFELDLRMPNGSVRTVLDTAYQVDDPATGEVLFHGILVDITDRKRLERQLRELTIRDPLTGCYNRRFLHDRAPELEARPDPWGCLVIDIDHFKEYNDSLGHDMGDRLLILVGRFLMSSVRVEDFVIRTGGDEFAVVLPGLGEAETRDAMSRVAREARAAGHASFTLGVASRERQERIEDTLRRADQDLVRIRIEERRLQPRASRRTRPDPA